MGQTGSVTYLADTRDGVIKKSVDSLDLALLLVGAEPHADAHSLDLLTFDFVVHKSHFALEVGEVLGDLTTGSLNSDDSAFAGNSNCANEVSTRSPTYHHLG